MTYLSFAYEHTTELPERADEVRSPDPLVEHFLRKYSESGDRVIDIFAGFDTTLRVAADLDQVPVGVEYEQARVDYITERSSMTDHVRQGDARELDLSDVPQCDCCFTSPPFMEQTDDRNPFENYAGRGSYTAYLEDIQTAFRRLEAVLAPGAPVTVDIANMKHDGRVTPLARDVPSVSRLCYDSTVRPLSRGPDNGIRRLDRAVMGTGTITRTVTSSTGIGTSERAVSGLAATGPWHAAVPH